MLFFYELWRFLNIPIIPAALTTAVIASDTGYALHTPVIPAIADKMKAHAIITMNPLISDVTKASLAFSTELKILLPTILIPANMNPAKYICIPFTAIRVSPASLCSGWHIFTAFADLFQLWFLSRPSFLCRND